MIIICPSCHLQPIEPFGDWEQMSCYCGHVIRREQMTTHKRTILDELTVTDPLDKKFKDEQMGHLGVQVNALLDVQAAIQNNEELLKELKRKEREINQSDIPKLMEALGFESVTVDGKKISVKDSVQCAIPAPSRPEAYSWMDKNGHGDLIKINLTQKFNRGEKEQAQKAVETLRDFAAPRHWSPRSCRTAIRASVQTTAP